MGELEKPGGIGSVMRSGLRRGDRVLEARAPVLRNLIGSEDRAMFSESVVARVRAMAADLAGHLAVRLAEAAGEADPRQWAEYLGEPLAAALIDTPDVLAHLHAAALEWQLTASLQRRMGIGPALSPLLQALVAADDPTNSPLAMDLLTAQSAFARQQGRMTLPLHELPPTVMESALRTMCEATGGDPQFEQHARAAAEGIRDEYDPTKPRVVVADQLAGSLGSGGFAALSVAHAGAAIFLSVLGLASGEGRDTMAAATGESQFARLALSLRAAGLGNREIAREFAAIHPDVTLPDGFGELGDRDARLLLSDKGGDGESDA